MTPPAPPWTPERQAELRRLCEAATPGPWSAGIDGNDRIYGPDNTEHAGMILIRGANKQFIAAARTALPDALAEIERLQVTNSAAVDDAQRRADAAEARWEALKAWLPELARQCDADSASGEWAVTQIAARLEREPPQRKPFQLDVSKEWCERMAELEDGSEVGAGGEPTSARRESEGA